jgi:hypothetical protein
MTTFNHPGWCTDPLRRGTEGEASYELVDRPSGANCSRALLEDGIVGVMAMGYSFG